MWKKQKEWKNKGENRGEKYLYDFIGSLKEGDTFKILNSYEFKVIKHTPKQMKIKGKIDEIETEYEINNVGINIFIPDQLYRDLYAEIEIYHGRIGKVNWNSDIVRITQRL